MSSRRRHTRLRCDWSSDVCSSDLYHWDGGKQFLFNSFKRNEIYGELYLYDTSTTIANKINPIDGVCCRSEERRVGKESRSRSESELYIQSRRSMRTYSVLTCVDMW